MVNKRSRELIDFEIRILGLTSSNNQVSLTTKKRSAQGMVPPRLEVTTVTWCLSIKGRKSTKSP